MAAEPVAVVVSWYLVMVMVMVVVVVMVAGVEVETDGREVPTHISCYMHIQ